MIGQVWRGHSWRGMLEGYRAWLARRAAWLRQQARAREGLALLRGQRGEYLGSMEQVRE